MYINRNKKYNKQIIDLDKKFNIPYGVCTINKKKGRLLKMEEKPSQSVLANTGLYICEPSVLNCLPKKNRFGMNDLINVLQKKRKKNRRFPNKRYRMARYRKLA